MVLHFIDLDARVPPPAGGRSAPRPNGQRRRRHAGTRVPNGAWAITALGWTHSRPYSSCATSSGLRPANWAKASYAHSSRSQGAPAWLSATRACATSPWRWLLY